MLLRRSVAVLCLVGWLYAPALGQVKLERKINENSKRTIEATTTVAQKLTIAGMNTETSSDSRTTVTVSVGKRDGAGQVRVQEKIDAIQITTKLMGQEYSFDSANPDKTGTSLLEGVRPLHKALVGRVTTTVFDKNNAITAVEFDEQVLNGVPDQVRDLVKGQFDAEKIKEAANDEIKRIPTDPVKPGETWERTVKSQLGAGQVLTLTNRYTYEGEVERSGKKYDRITTKVTAVAFAFEETPLPITLKSSDIKPTESKGEILFDRALGTAVETTSSMRIVGDMTFVINGMELPSKLDLKMESTMSPKE